MRWRRLSTLIAAVSTLAISLIVAACGGSGPHHGTPSASNSGVSVSRAQINQDMVRFADCMRNHGVPGYPDPNTDPHAFKNEFNSSSPAFLSAMPHCQQLLPNGGRQSHTDVHSQAQTDAMLAFVRCLRTHGFPNFPDPTSSGDLNHQMVAAAGINLSQPATLQAGDACVGVSHGYITRADVARFVAGH